VASPGVAAAISQSSRDTPGACRYNEQREKTLALHSESAGMRDQSKPASRRWRRYLRFSVRGLIVVVLVVGGWLGWIVRGARIQREAVAAITRAGGRVAYDWERRDGKDIPGGAPWAPRRIVDQAGVDYFGRASFVSLPMFFARTRNPEIFGEVTNDNDLVMAHVGCLVTLLELDIPSVSDAGLATVNGLCRLKILRCSGACITDAGLAHLKDLPQLSTLELSDNQITDSGMLHLRMLTELTELGIGNTHITDAGLAHLRVLTKLKELKLSRTQVTDAGMVCLKGLTNLLILDLAGTQVTDAGFAHLKGLTNLTDLDLSETRVTDTGVKDLQRALPKVKLVR
jgi:Leucine Rich repeat